MCSENKIFDPDKININIIWDDNSDISDERKNDVYAAIYTIAVATYRHMVELGKNREFLNNKLYEYFYNNILTEGIDGIVIYYPSIRGYDSLCFVATFREYEMETDCPILNLGNN